MRQVKGVLDRIEEDKFGVILVEENQKEYTISIEKLPNGSTEGTWFKINVIDDEIVAMSIDNEVTSNLQNEIETKFNRIKEKAKGSRFKR